jgi:thiamine monophosphate kinase
MHNVLTPTPKIKVMRELAGAGLLNAAMDDSDGLYPSLAQLAASNHVGIVIDADDIAFDPTVAAMARRLDIDPLRLALGWGDWHIVAACSPSLVEAVVTVAARHGVAVHEIGTFTREPGVWLKHQGSIGPLIQLDSERFTSGSWFSSGLDGYISALREAPLFAGTGETGGFG